jgi:hypothetical protein
VPNPIGFKQGLFGSWIQPAKMPNNFSPVPIPFGFSIENDTNSMAGRIKKQIL